MVFGTLEIWLILPFALIMYYLIPPRFRWSILLIGSFFYLGYFSLPFLVYASIYSILNYFFGRILGQVSNQIYRKRLYLVFLVLNIGQLLVYKYIDFIIENINWSISLVHLEPIPYLKLLVPLGISYYTFQCVGYIINIYRKTEKPETHLGYFVIYNLFFPKILSGPIERSERFLPQLRNPKPFNPEQIRHGLKLILFGVFKKLVIAERLGVIINNVYGSVDDFSGLGMIVTMLLQAFYIYTDFSGYTDIALGIANLFGISLTNNFNRPFLAKSISDFWRRWHISLTNWCNDYIFKTIIFKRRRWGKKASVYAVFMTFLIIGIWHGPKWTFLILGILQGIAINYEFFTRRKRLQIGSKIPKFLNDLLSRLITYLYFSFSLIFFFAHSFRDSVYFVKNLFKIQGSSIFGNNFGLDNRNVKITLIAMILLIIIEYLDEVGVRSIEFVYRMPLVVRWVFYYAIIILIFMFAQFATTNFIYLQF